MNINKHPIYLNMMFFILLCGLMFFADANLFIITYIALFIFVTLRTLITPSTGKVRRYLVISYFAIMILQVIMVNSIVFGETAVVESVYIHLFRRLVAVAMLLLPLLVSRYIIAGKYAHFYLPTIEETATIGFSELIDVAEGVKRTIADTTETGKKLSINNILEVAADISRHDSFSYINNGSLTDDYFQKTMDSLSDPNIYLVISKTGSPASEIISVFTQKQYNHASLSFDKELKTAISYNGGEKVYPPGLNAEMIEFFSKTPGAKILIYSLPCPTEKKILMIDKIKEINQQGSAYNMLGLLLKRSYKPNIMFCSQFVYKMIDYAGLSYFSKADGKVSPTDLVELDYYKKLRFEKEIEL
ncbi:MAG: hypothetical protein FWE24_04375 [Defluviitaleaceae bacterium]|nr:hypothetical protein [Defluviitaleaceae bacterium]